jgi:uncharacterized membrane protein
MNTQHLDTRKLVFLALLTAIVVVLQVLATVIPVYPFRLNLSLIPIVVGAAMIAPFAGGWLGLVFGAVVIFTSPDVAIFMTYNAVATILIILARGTLAGLSAGWVYKALAQRGKTTAVIIAAAVCPIVNTGIFIIGVYAFFLPVLVEWGVTGITDITSFVFLGMVGINFVFEFGANLVLSPAIVRLIQHGQSKLAEA